MTFGRAGNVGLICDQWFAGCILRVIHDLIGLRHHVRVSPQADTTRPSRNAFCRGTNGLGWDHL